MTRFAIRRDALRRLLAEKSLPPLLVIDERNVTYLTGFTGDSTYLLVAPGRYRRNEQRQLVRIGDFALPGETD